jgi:RNA polymerase sigma-70 factor (ECF subfamily)
LLLGLQAHDPRAWQRLVYLYAPLVACWCRQRGLQAADADDVVQEVFRTVLARIGDFRRTGPQSTFRGWLWTITRHKLGDHFRRAARPDAVSRGDLDHLLAAGPPAEDDTGLYRRVLELVRGQFEEGTWQAFWRVVVEDRTPAFVAEELELSVNAVYLAKSRVLRRLREMLGEAE